jgi:hypothetical protein
MTRKRVAFMLAGLVLIVGVVLVGGLRQVGWCDDFTGESGRTGECHTSWQWRLW